MRPTPITKDNDVTICFPINLSADLPPKCFKSIVIVTEHAVNVELKNTSSSNCIAVIPCNKAPCCKLNKSMPSFRIIENKIPGDNSDEMPNNDNIGVNICDKTFKIGVSDKTLTIRQIVIKIGSA